MRIAYVINSLEGGGAALPLPAVVRLLQGEGAEVRVLALARRDGRAATALNAAAIDYRVRPTDSGGHLAAARWLLAEVRAYQPTLIWTSLVRATLLGQLVGLVTRTPVVSWQHNAFLKPANLALLRLTRRLTRLWVADSDSVAELTRERLRLPAGDVTVWPLMIATRPSDAPPRHREGEVFRIGSLGRLHPNKGYDVLVKALATLARAQPALPPFEVVIGGEGSERETLETAAREAGVETLVLAGFQARPNAFLATCHAYVQPSRAEGLCIAAHEAMQAGLPVIVSDVGEMARTVEDGVSGFVVPPEDDAALADAIRRLVADPAAVPRMGERAQARVLERFDGAQFRAAGRVVAARAVQLSSR